MMKNLSPSLKALIDKHPTLDYKECYLDENDHVVVVFYSIVKDCYGYESFEEFFVTDLQGTQLRLEDHEYEQLKKCV
jgi:hypothetical protein